MALMLLSDQLVDEHSIRDTVGARILRIIEASKKQLIVTI